MELSRELTHKNEDGNDGTDADGYNMNGYGSNSGNDYSSTNQSEKQTSCGILISPTSKAVIMANKAELCS